MTKSENVPILGIFSPKTILMFRVGLKKINVGRQQEPHIFQLSLSLNYVFFAATVMESNQTNKLMIRPLDKKIFTIFHSNFLSIWTLA